MKLSVIIVSWNVKYDLLNCLKSLYESCASCQFEVIVVDNASTDGSAEATRDSFPQAKLIINSENRGFAAAANQTIKIARGEYILLLNPDTLVHRSSLDNLVRVLDEEPAVGACGPRLVDVEGKTYPSIGYLPTFRSVLYGKTFFRTIGIFRSHYKKLTANDFDYDKLLCVEQLSGAVLMVRRSVFEEIGLMDESFFMYYEDADLCLRVRKAGWKIVYTPTSIVTHIGGRSSIQVSAKKRMMVYSSLLTYLRKYRGRFATRMFSLIFKPAVIVKEISNVFSGTITFLVSILLCNRGKWSKSLAKTKSSAIFLVRYSWRFLFKT